MLKKKTESLYGNLKKRKNCFKPWLISMPEYTANKCLIYLKRELRQALSSSIMRCFMAQNAGKLFEADVKSSIPKNCWYYRLRDNASSFAGGGNTRFTSNNICDCLIFDDVTKTLLLVECKSTKGTSVPLTMIRENQKNGLLEASQHHLIAGLLVNYRNENNDTFFITINDYVEMVKRINKKSFNIKDLVANGAVKVGCSKKRSRYRYEIGKLINEIHL